MHSKITLPLLAIIWLFFSSLANAEPLRVFVSIPPVETFVERVGGKYVDTQSMVGTGENPHTYTPSHKQIRDLTKASIYISAGIPFEDAWMNRIRSANPGMKVIDTTDIHDKTEHDKTEHDIHTWTNPLQAKLIAHKIRDALISIDPSNKQIYLHNYKVFAAELDLLNQDIIAIFRGKSNRKFMVFHPVWGHFADHYGLTQIAIEHEEKDPGARTLVGLIKLAKDEGIRVIFIQPQLNRKFAEQIAEAIEGQVISIDPLSADYINNLYTVAQQLSEAMR